METPAETGTCGAAARLVRAGAGRAWRFGLGFQVLFDAATKGGVRDAPACWPVVTSRAGWAPTLPHIRWNRGLHAAARAIRRRCRWLVFLLRPHLQRPLPPTRASFLARTTPWPSVVSAGRSGSLYGLAVSPREGPSDPDCESCRTSSARWLRLERQPEVGCEHGPCRHPLGSPDAGAPA